MEKRKFISYAKYTERLHYFESAEQKALIEEYAHNNKVSRGAAIRDLVATGLVGSGGKPS